MRLFAFLFTCLFAFSVQAKCLVKDEIFLSCSIQNGKKFLDVCFNDTQISYRFGTIGGKIELELNRSLKEIEYTPWPGVGRTIWESVIFENDGVRYEVHGAIDKKMTLEDDETPIRGGVAVHKDKTQLSHIECDAGSVEFSYAEGLFDAKKAVGQCFEHGVVGWHDCK